jgi:hypothetical protein
MSRTSRSSFRFERPESRVKLEMRRPQRVLMDPDQFSITAVRAPRLQSND